MKKTIGVELEVEFLPIYKNQPLFGDIQNYLYTVGFEFIDFISICRWERKSHNGLGQCIFGDALFLRTPENIIEIANSDISIIAKYMGICLIYNRYDLIDRVIELLPANISSHFDPFSALVMPLKEKQLRLNRITKNVSRFIMRFVGSDYQAHLLY